MAVPFIGIVAVVLAVGFAVLFLMAVARLARAARTVRIVSSVREAIEGGLDGAILLGRIVVDETGTLLGVCTDATAARVRMKRDDAFVEADAGAVRYEGDRLVALAGAEWRPAPE
ncbi:MAG: hypothetical protein ACYDCK_08310 [Thermoplasmatota archaeon]